MASEAALVMIIICNGTETAMRAIGLCVPYCFDKLVTGQDAFQSRNSEHFAVESGSIHVL